MKNNNMKFFNAGNVTVIIGWLMVAYAFYSYFSHWFLGPINTPVSIRVIPTIEEK